MQFFTGKTCGDFFDFIGGISCRTRYLQEMLQHAISLYPKEGTTPRKGIPSYEEKIEGLSEAEANDVGRLSVVTFEDIDARERAQGKSQAALLSKLACAYEQAKIGWYHAFDTYREYFEWYVNTVLDLQTQVLQKHKLDEDFIVHAGEYEELPFILWKYHENGNPYYDHYTDEYASGVSIDFVSEKVLILCCGKNEKEDIPSCIEAMSYNVAIPTDPEDAPYFIERYLQVLEKFIQERAPDKRKKIQTKIDELQKELEELDAEKD